MNANEMAVLLNQYNQSVNMTNVYRYTNTVKMVSDWPDVFGMNFEAIIHAPADKQAGIFLLQEERAKILRSIMDGGSVEDSEMQKYFGFTFTELTKCRADINPIKKPIPKNLCLLSFDDALKSQYVLALPILEKFGFNATFFITEKGSSPMGAGFEDKDTYMTWEQIQGIEKAGYELGNHSLNHVFGAEKMSAEFNLAQIKGLEEDFEKHGLKKPVTYAYPSGIANEMTVSCARDCGYMWGRGNLEREVNGFRGMTYYDPITDSPLAICSFGDVDFYTEELLRERIHSAPEGMILGLTYHDVSPEKWPGSCPFERQMEILSDEGMKVTSIADLSEYIDPVLADKCTDNNP